MYIVGYSLLIPVIPGPLKEPDLKPLFHVKKQLLKEQGKNDIIVYILLI